MKTKWFTRYMAEADGDGNDLGGGEDVNAGADDQGDQGGGEGDQGGGEGDQGSKDVTPYWPEDWRAKLSPDGKHSKTLDRFDSPAAVFNSYLSLRQRVDSGELRSNAPFPAEGSDEDKATWRKAHGIPESASAYDIKLAEGVVMGEADKPFVENFLGMAHTENIPPAHVNSVLSWYYQNQERILDQQEEADNTLRQQTEDTLRAEWGNEYRVNINLVKGLVSTMPESIRDSFIGARLGDGRAALNDPDMARWLTYVARQLNPTATIVPGASGNLTSAIEDEIDQIEKVMRENRQQYNNDEKMQARLRQLYDARQRAKA